MLELIQTVHVLAGVFILGALGILFIFGLRTLRPDLHYTHLLRKAPF